MTTLVLATKLLAPMPWAELVDRLRLLDRLEGTLIRGHRLTLVSALAGFGKTTLLSPLIRRHELTGWLSLHDGDNAPPRFLGSARQGGSRSAGV